MTQQMLPELRKGKMVVEVKIFVEEGAGGTLIISGERVAIFRQLSGVAAEKWVSKLLVPAVVFGLSSRFLAGTPSVVAAMIGLVAALLAFAIEVGLFVYHGNEWKWKEVP